MHPVDGRHFPVRYFPGTRINYSCMSGYSATPPEWGTRICQDSGNWTGGDATCTPSKETT